MQLPEALFEAILEVHRLRSRPALARQRQYIGRLMREVDPAPIERALAEFLRSGDAKCRRELPEHEGVAGELAALDAETDR